MFSSRGEEIPVEPETQENRELNIVRRFDFWNIQNGPQKGAVILRFLGFGVVRLVGVNPDQARVGDIAMEVVHCRNPTLAKCGGEAQHWEKVKSWSPSGLPNVQSSTARGKTPCIGVFLVSLERS
jgi:hypothetical protein